ncbi:MAG: DUF2442 domain-containing protein [Candidatus Caenarcaniphilales bacterium]|nr:DUF2442 domain-containing protein [Candidatus Caenarcaniphilales bacterium]
MKSKKLGENISEVELQGISNTGIWLFIDKAEYFLPFELFPWFKEAKISEIQNVELIHGHHLRWDDLDVDLDIESIKDPEGYPKVYE